ncbi:MAG: hypothetical protein R3C15_17830 [Thermoleophilia bacterium]
MTLPRRSCSRGATRLLVLALAALGFVLGVMPSMAAAGRASRLVALDAGSGTLVPIPGTRGAFRLTLHDVRPTALAFDDRPGLEQGVITVERMLDGLFVEGQPGPNAAIDAIVGDGELELMGVKLERPRYDRATATLRFRVQRLRQERRLGVGTRTDTVLPRAFGRTALFVDNCCATRQSVTVFNTSPLSIQVSVNNGPFSAIQGAFPGAWTPQSATFPFSLAPQQPNVLAYGTNLVAIVPTGAIAPVTVAIAVPSALNVTSLQLYVSLDGSGGVEWVLLNGGVFVSGSTAPAARLLARAGSA